MCIWMSVILQPRKLRESELEKLLFNSKASFRETGI